MGIAVFCKLVLQLILLPNPACSIEGAAIASSVCYLIAFFVDLFYTVREEKTAHAAQRLWHLSGDREKV
jgi:Na+-driven multidrug efflux pump